MSKGYNIAFFCLHFVFSLLVVVAYRCDVVGICLYEPGAPPPPTDIYTGLFAWNLSLPYWPQTSVVYGDLANIRSSSNWFSKSGYSDFGYYYTQEISSFSSEWKIITSSLVDDDYKSFSLDYLRASRSCLGSDLPGVALVLANVSNTPAILKVTFHKEIVVTLLDKSVLDEVGPISTSKYNNPYEYCGFAKHGTLIGQIKLDHSTFFFLDKSKTMFLFYDTSTGQKVASLSLPSFSESRSITLTHPVADTSRNLILLHYSSPSGELVTLLSTVDGSVISERKLFIQVNVIPEIEASINEENHLYYYSASILGKDAYSYGYVIDYLNESRQEVNLYLDPRRWGSSMSGGMASSSLHSFTACNF